jgi:hypothetical protein
MERSVYQQRMFFIGAIWNWGGALFFGGISLFYQPMLPYFLNQIPENMLWFHMFIGVVFVFGLGYYWISKDIKRNRDLIKMGIIGKTFVFCMLFYAWQAGIATVLFFLAGSVDLLFTLLFVEVLIKLKD